MKEGRKARREERTDGRALGTHFRESVVPGQWVLFLVFCDARADGAESAVYHARATGPYVALSMLSCCIFICIESSLSCPGSSIFVR